MMEFFSENQMFIVLLVILLIWGGIVWYLLKLDKKIKDLENYFKKG